MLYIYICICQPACLHEDLELQDLRRRQQELEMKVSLLLWVAFLCFLQLYWLIMVIILMFLCFVVQCTEL